jgi:hypothetical protein
MATRRCWTWLAPMDARSASEEGDWLGPGLCAWQRGLRSLPPPVPCGRTGLDACSGSVTASEEGEQASGRTSSS